MLWHWQVEEQPGDPWGNMERDSALLAALEDGSETCPTFRIYRWDRAAVSYGRLQSEEAVARSFPHLPRVRRPTGGRAVVHGEDLTITAAASLECLPVEAVPNTLNIYRLLISGVVRALQQTGVPAIFGNDGSARYSKVVNCFDLAAGGDLVDQRTGRKLLGSAQRREGNSVLQQMSLPLANIGNISDFIAGMQAAYRDSLQIEGWLTIDTPDRVW